MPSGEKQRYSVNSEITLHAWRGKWLQFHCWPPFPQLKPVYRPVLTWGTRIIVGVVSLASALGKSLDLPGFVEVLATYQLFSDHTLWPIAFGITGFEWVLGVWLLAGWQIQTCALLAVIMYGLYAAGLVVTLFRGIDLPNCGCYGVFFPQPLRWYSPLEDMVLVGMCYALWRSEKSVRTC